MQGLPMPRRRGGGHQNSEDVRPGSIQRGPAAAFLLASSSSLLSLDSAAFKGRLGQSLLWPPKWMGAHSSVKRFGNKDHEGDEDESHAMLSGRSAGGYVICASSCEILSRSELVGCF